MWSFGRFSNKTRCIKRIPLSWRLHQATAENEVSGQMCQQPKTESLVHRFHVNSMTTAMKPSLYE